MSVARAHRGSPDPVGSPAFVAPAPRAGHGPTSADRALPGGRTTGWGRP